MARLTHIWKTGVVVTALLATVVACGNSDSSRARNAALVAGTTCTKPGQISKISKVSVVCAKTITGNIWYPTTKSYGRSVACIKSGAVRKKKSVVWVCGVVKSKKLWLATSPLPPAVLQATAVVAPGVVEPVPVLESTEVATPSRPVVADNNVLANPNIADEPPVTTPAIIPTIPSAPVTIATIPSAPPIASVPSEKPIAPISYKVGDTGPGGGTVFYYSKDAFTSTGSDCGTDCHYLEAAHRGWEPHGNGNDCTQSNFSIQLNDPMCEWSGNTSTAIPGDAARGQAIGTGHANTTAIIAQSDTAGKAATAARAFQGGAKTDWFLPSRYELNELCKYAWTQTTGATGTGCASSGAIREGFSTGIYWSSSESDDTKMWAQRINPGDQFSLSKTNTYHVRPVRAFAGTCAIGGACAVGEKGPGGGIVFYVAIEKFPCGATLTQACNYLEVAPLDKYAREWATTAANCYAVGSTSGTSSCQTNSIYSGDSVAQDASRTAATAIGMGMANTNQIYARLTAAGSVETDKLAAGIAWEYTNNSKTDWYLPSKDELNELCKFLRNAYGQKEQAVGSGTLCVSYSQNFISYYSSSEIDGSTVLLQSFGDGNRGAQAKKYLSYPTRVRPVRAF